MPDQTTAQRLCINTALWLQTMQNYGALFTHQFITGTRLEVTFEDGEVILISFSKKSK